MNVKLGLRGGLFGVNRSHPGASRCPVIERRIATAREVCVTFTLPSSPCPVVIDARGVVAYSRASAAILPASTPLIRSAHSGV